jgi:hypothetical protein
VLLDFLDVDSFAACISRNGFNIGGTAANGRVRFIRRSSCTLSARLRSSSLAVGAASPLTLNTPAPPYYIQ